MNELSETEADVLRVARRRVGGRVGFIVHAAVYAVVNVFLMMVNLGTSPHQWWFLWVVSGWGVGLALHGFAALGIVPRLAEMEEREVARELERRTKP